MIKFSLAAVVLLLMLLGIDLYHYGHKTLDLPAEPVAFDLKAGSGLLALSEQMQAAHALPRGSLSLLQFRLLAKVTGQAGRIKAGFYVVDSPLTPLQLLRKLVKGDVTPRQIRFVEGWTFAQMRTALDAYPWIDHASRDMSEAEILKTLNIPHTHAEGWFFPATYDISTGSTDLSILKRAYRVMQQRLALAWRTRAAGLPYLTPEQALTMASIIEKETGDPIERPLIAAVFLNRLHLGMRLQTDPCVIYGLGSTFDGNLHKRDLQTDTLYNTYTRAGLPPTPIAMPGMASIEAALHPANSKDLYFVAKGNGTHCFTQRLADHNRAVARYQKRLKVSPK
uniref:Putative Aminodeoxychorismate lyase n=1 Tax=mine drainage metagenome TaxID=410659 RepID=E6QRZ3_9ZZZZ